MAEIEVLRKLAQETSESQERLRQQEERDREEEQKKQHDLQEKAVNARLEEIRQKELEFDEKRQALLNRLAQEDKLKEISKKEHAQKELEFEKKRQELLNRLEHEEKLKEVKRLALEATLKEEHELKQKEDHRADLKERQLVLKRKMSALDREIENGEDVKRPRTNEAGNTSIVETSAGAAAVEVAAPTTPLEASGFQGANSCSHYDEWRRFTTKCKAKIRADSNMSKAFLQGGRAAHEAFETFLQAWFQNCDHETGHFINPACWYLCIDNIRLLAHVAAFDLQCFLWQHNENMDACEAIFEKKLAFAKNRQGPHNTHACLLLQVVVVSCVALATCNMHCVISAIFCFKEGCRKIAQ